MKLNQENYCLWWFLSVVCLPWFFWGKWRHRTIVLAMIQLMPSLHPKHCARHFVNTQSSRDTLTTVPSTVDPRTDLISLLAGSCSLQRWTSHLYIHLRGMELFWDKQFIKVAEPEPKPFFGGRDPTSITGASPGTSEQRQSSQHRFHTGRRFPMLLSPQAKCALLVHQVSWCGVPLRLSTHLFYQT